MEKNILFYTSSEKALKFLCLRMTRFNEGFCGGFYRVKNWVRPFEEMGHAFMYGISIKYK